MSWPMPPNAVQWNPNAMGMNPDPNVASYTPEQWAAIQQQNWQQWSQWQQQYAEWHKQYGDKYAQQMQTFTGMGGIPPPPSTSGPQPPPPPDKPPPPPPPHENNQPLYGNNILPPTSAPAPAPAPAPVPVPPPIQRTTNYSNINLTPSSNQWPTNTEHKQHQTQPSVNSEALKKLAEEERLFDIQFKKWEEEIDKWRKENVNHPDKQAYKEYEQRFEGCRAQLMERREQMKQKRSRLMNNAANPNAPVPNAAIPSLVPPHSQNNYTPMGNFSNNSYNQQKLPQTYANTNYHQQTEPILPVQNRSNNISINTQDMFDPYKNSSQNNFPTNSDTSTFLPTSSSSKGIPGLDLVHETTVKKPDVIDITEEQANQHGPDYTTISKGINNILGDEKIMNILSMVRGDGSQNSNQPNVPLVNRDNNSQQEMYGNQQRSNYGQGLHYPASSGMQQDQYYDQNTSYMGNNMRPNMGHDPTPRGPEMRPGGGIRQAGPNMQQGSGLRPNMQQGSGLRPNMQQGSGLRPNMQLGTGLRTDMRQGGPDMRQGGPNMRHGAPNIRPNGPDMRQIGPNMRPPGPGMPHGIQQGAQNYRLNGPNIMNQGSNTSGNQQPQFNNAPRPLMQTLVQRPVRPPLIENVPHQQSAHGSEYYNEQERNVNENSAPIVNQPPRPKWVEEPMFTPSIVVEYEHKPLRLKARDFIEPAHTFDYNHQAKDGDLRRKAIEKEAEELFVRKPRREREEDDDRYSRDLFHRDDRRMGREDRIREPLRDYRERPREEMRDDYSRDRPKDERDFDRRRDDFDWRFEDRRRDDRDRMRRDDFRDHRERDDSRDYRRREDKDFHRDRSRDGRREDSRNRSRSRDRDSQKRALSRENEFSNVHNKKSKEDLSALSKHIVMIDDLLEPPGRDIRPAKIVIILRGPPGSGKSYLAKLIRDREADYGGTARIMSIDDYFMQEGELEEKDPGTGKIVKKPTLKYEYDESSEDIYITSLKRAFKRSLTDGYFSFLIYDAVNDTLKTYADVWNYARQNGFQVYICTMDLDPQVCYKRNIHNRKLCDIETICARFFPTPNHHIQLDPTTLLQNAAIPDVQMEDVQDDVIMEDVEPEVENVFTSKWEKMDDANQLARLDGTNKPLRSSQLSMEDYLQLDEWKPNVAKPGKKTVRWADIEERREQEKMRAIGFVVGQTDWNRMTDPTMGSSALTQTKYIERVKKF